MFAGRWTPLISFGLFLAFWIVASIALNVKERIRHVRGGMFERLRAQGRSYWGMQFAHLGIAVFVVGVTVVNGYQVERDMRMNVGDTVQVGRYDIKFNGTQKLAGANYTGVRGDDRSLARRQCGGDDAARKTHLQRAEDADDRSCHRHRTVGRYLRFARRADRSGVGGIRCMERARVSQAVRYLDLGRMRADGVGRRSGAVRSSLSIAGAACRWRCIWTGDGVSDVTDRALDGFGESIAAA